MTEIFEPTAVVLVSDSCSLEAAITDLGLGNGMARP